MLAEATSMSIGWPGAFALVGIALAVAWVFRSVCGK